MSAVCFAAVADLLTRTSTMKAEGLGFCFLLLFFNAHARIVEKPAWV
jgi:hypothetical protein